jgi:hypothetical protein
MTHQSTLNSNDMAYANFGDVGCGSITLKGSGSLSISTYKGGSLLGIIVFKGSNPAIRLIVLSFAVRGNSSLLISIKGCCVFLKWVGNVSNNLSIIENGGVFLTIEASDGSENTLKGSGSSTLSVEGDLNKDSGSLIGRGTLTLSVKGELNKKEHFTVCSLLKCIIITSRMYIPNINRIYIILLDFATSIYEILLIRRSGNISLRLSYLAGFELRIVNKNSGLLLSLPSEKSSDDVLCIKINTLEMVRLDGDCSNSLLDVLEDWNTALKGNEREIRQVLKRPRGPSL